MRIDIELHCAKCGRKIYGAEIKHTWDGVCLQIPPCSDCMEEALNTKPPEPEQESPDATD